MLQIPYQIADYTVLPMTIPKTSSFLKECTHTIYLHQHAPKIPTPNDSRCLFIANTPTDSTEAHFRAILNTLIGAGRFESITFEHQRNHSSNIETAIILPKFKEKKRKRENVEERQTSSAEVNLPSVTDRPLHKSGSTAVMTLADAKSVEAVLKAIKKLHKTRIYPVWGQNADGTPISTPGLGSNRCLTHQHLKYPSRTSIENSVNAYMAAFNSVEEAAARAAKQARNIPDEDGFVTVSRGGRTGPARKEEAEEARRKELEKEEAKRESMGDFYRFQGREKRKAEQGELIRRFEEDRRRVEELKAERRGRFRPE